MPESTELKNRHYYEMWTRSTLYFEVGCDVGSVEDAVNLLKDMSEAHDDSYVLNY